MVDHKGRNWSRSPIRVSKSSEGRVVAGLRCLLEQRHSFCLIFRNPFSFKIANRQMVVRPLLSALRGLQKVLECSLVIFFDTPSISVAEPQIFARGRIVAAGKRDSIPTDCFFVIPRNTTCSSVVTANIVLGVALRL